MSRKYQRKLLYLVLGFGGIYLSMDIFPMPAEMTSSHIIATLVFEPFQLLGAVICFIIGFLSFARLFQSSFEHLVHCYNSNHPLQPIELFALGMTLISFFVFFLINVWVAILALITALFYGIMDADFNEKSDQKHQKKESSD
ncbi:hypothetical protein [Desertibacillus haloalkaliphilus]|uniref:hypothetical protein n=1 Tax=Desertibacillus haloalkaliphilus TaxID=1328930 RepID=UPI001C278D1C|nr:hypothetical protein [Desertibacillus haloalkaliphilus]MBU8907206.1 hypothetical protein [Desertibacillus haloalkaliphilus]